MQRGGAGRCGARTFGPGPGPSLHSLSLSLACSRVPSPSFPRSSVPYSLAFPLFSFSVLAVPCHAWLARPPARSRKPTNPPTDFFQRHSQLLRLQARAMLVVTLLCAALGPLALAAPSDDANRLFDFFFFLAAISPACFHIVHEGPLRRRGLGG